MKYRVWVEKSEADRTLELEVFAETEASADAAGKAFLKVYPDSHVFKQDVPGVNPPEVFVVGFPNWFKPVTDEQRAALNSALVPLSLVEPGSPHDIVDLSRLA